MSVPLPKMRLGAEELKQTANALGLEWLVTNGLGGYASSTVLGVNTRKYHGLLVSALTPPTNRHVMLAKLDEEVQIGNQTYKLGVNEFRDTFYPKPEGLLQEFVINTLPVFRYNAGEVRLQKSVFMPRGRNATIVAYDVQNMGANRVVVRVFPLVNFRHFYYTTHKNQLNWNFSQRAEKQGAVIRFYPAKQALAVFTTKGTYNASQQDVWIENIYLRVDAARNEDCLDDCLSPGHFEIPIGPNEQEQFIIIAAAEETEDEVRRVLQEIARDDLLNQELTRQESLLTQFQKQNAEAEMKDWLKWAVLATDAFIVNRASTRGKSVIAGYHWFEDWGRDTLISLPGLTLINGRFSDAKEILLTFVQYCDRGVIPNHFPERAGDKPEYNTVDASLWYVNAVWQYLQYTGDFSFVRDHLWDTLQSIVGNYANGTLNNIHMTDDSLIAHGSRLTWMDATVDSTAVTPREGKAVEIQALWYNALRIVQHLAGKFNSDSAEKYANMADKTRDSFLRKFWNLERNCLFDVITDGQKDSAFRPNQILAASLDFSMLDEAKRSLVVYAVQSKLWCPYGLRTLSPDDPNYVGKYGGDLTQRNRAYHNGTVWPWLLGPFITAFLKTKPEAERRQFALREFLIPFFQKTILDAGLGTISEIYDGDPPHSPSGCIAQAWSVAEPLRALVEDASFKRPPFEGRVRATCI
jgi:predicted glycogen debranching enzyme